MDHIAPTNNHNYGDWRLAKAILPHWSERNLIN